MAAVIDTGRIAAFTSLPDTTISTLIENPTTELVKSFLESLTPKIQEHEELRSQKLKQDVEIETVVRSNESKVKVLKASVEKSLTDAGNLRTELQQSENARSKLESELAEIKSTTSNDASETTTLKSRIERLEASNRDTLAVLESKSASYDKLAEDLSAQHQKAVELRRQVSTLEQNLQTANSASASSRFREQSLEQEIELLKKNNEWFETELKTKSAENTKFRKDKTARIAELQRQNELTISENDSLKRTEATLRNRLEEQVQKVEEHLNTIQELREEAISLVQGHRIELDSTSRLADLQKQRADSANARVQELSASLEEVRDEASDEIGRLRAEVETEHQEVEAAQHRVSELEETVERLESELANPKAPETPTKNTNGHGSATPVRVGTPSNVGSPMPGSRFRGSLSTTQLYAECRKLEKQLLSEQRRNEELSNTLEEVAGDLESNKPEIEQLRNDHARLEAEMVEMSSLMDAAAAERDDAVKEARKTKGDVQSLTQEGNILRQQLRDLSSEIKILLMEQHLRENGQNLSAEDIAELKAAAMVSSSELDGMTDTGRIISEHLTTFKHISELQENNSKLLRMIRELGDRMENEEARERDQTRQQEREELEQLRTKVATYKDELQAMVVQSKSYVKERDMFRSMLTRRGPTSNNIEPADFSRSMPMPAGETPASPPQRFGQSMFGASVTDAVDYAKLLKDLQIHFDAYKQEAATDHTALKSQVADLSKKNGDLQTETSRTSSQLTAATQRGEMLQANFDMLRTENNELQKRVYAVMENASKQELRAQQVAEELVEAHGMLDTLRREAANLKAEKDLWKSIEKRLLDDNESLRNDRSRLDKLNGSLQNMLNEREQADSETRRRLQANVESLDSELQTTKRKLNDELEESRKATLRREYEHEQNQKRIDDLVTSLGSIREELSGAKTSKDHLQARVDELTVELRSAEERVQVLQSRPAAVQPPEVMQASENLVSREQELAVEVSELKRDIDLKTAEVDRANEQIEDYKRIAQATEERLQELEETNGEYREETDRTLDERANKINDLEQRLTDISTELSTTNAELSKLRDEQTESGGRLSEQKAHFEAEIARLKDEDERHATAAQFHQQDLKAQAEIAQRAQQNYEAELLKHAEAAKTLQTVRGEANQLKIELVEIKSEADAAKSSLAEKEESWSEQRDRYERELTDLRKRREEVMGQNNILHQRLEGLSNQISALQRDRAALAESEPEGAVSGLEDLQEVIRYLRREKEIVDVQYHLSTQEAKRLRQQLDHTQTQLDDTRLKLDQQRRVEADAERNALNHSKLMETLNELNLFRESSVTLRAQYKEAEANLTEKTKRVEELSAEIEPLQIRIGELENLTETREGEMKLLQEDRDRWRDRTNNILQKYDRVDPAEVEAQKERLATLEKEREEAVQAKEQLQQQLDAVPEQIESAKSDLRARLGEQFKTRSKQLSGQVREKQAEVDAANTQKTELETQLKQAREALEAATSTATAQKPQTNGESTPSESNANVKELQDKIAGLEATIAEKDQQLQSLKAEYEQRTRTREAELNQALSQKASQLRSEHEDALNNALKELEDRLKASHAQELQAARTKYAQAAPQSTEPGAAAAPAPSQTEAPSQSPAVTEELPTLSDAQVRLLVQKSEVIRNILRSNIQKAAAKAKEDAKKDLAAAASAADASISPDMISALEQKHSAEKATMAKELETKFAKDFETKLASEKEALIQEQEERFSNEKLTFSKESEKKIADQVAMAEKRTAVKLNMAQNQARMALCKIDVVKKAANETPERAVKEVWDEASVAKPPPANAQAPAAVPATPTPAKPESSTPAATPSVPATAESAPAIPAPAAPVMSKWASAVPVTQPQPDAPQATAAESKPESTGADEKSTAPAEAQPEARAPTPTGQEAQQSTGIPKPGQSNHAGTGPAALRGLQSGLPRGGRGGRGGLQSSKYATPQAQGQQPQGSVTSENPFAQSTQQNQQNQPARGSGIPRGGIPRGGARGRGGQGRGGNVQTSGIPQPGQQQAAQAGGGSPGGGMNPQAKQFNPGNKRARDESDGGSGDGLAGKRPRGGGTGAGA